MAALSRVPITYNAHLANHQDRSYADVPPTSPPPPLDDLLVPPPPFGVAIASQPLGEPFRRSRPLQNPTAAGEAEEIHESDVLATDPLLPAQPEEASIRSIRRLSQEASS